MSFYFDKYNMQFSDINPFCEDLKSGTINKKTHRMPKDEYSVYSKNLNRQV